MTAYPLADLVAHARGHSPFYAELYAGLPEQVGAITDLPVIDQEAFWAANPPPRPTGTPNRVLTGGLTDAFAFRSGGTTGTPKLSMYTRAEWQTFARITGQGMVDAGLRAGDRVANLFYAGDLYSSFLLVSAALEHAPVANVHVPVGGNTPLGAILDIVDDLAVTVLAVLPMTLCRLAEQLLADHRTAPGIRLVLYAGEAFFDDQRALVAQAFPNALIRSCGYASVDAGTVGLPTAGPDPRVHRTASPQTIVEILDEDIGEPVAEPGRPGRLVVTNLTRLLMPVLRYPVGDRGEWVDPVAGTYRLLGRSQEGARIGPFTIRVADLRRFVLGADDTGQITEAQLVARHRDGRDQLVLRLARRDDTRVPAPDVTDRTIRRVLDGQPDLARHIEAGYVHPVAVEWVPMHELTNPRTGKLLPMRDERHTGPVTR